MNLERAALIDLSVTFGPNPSEAVPIGLEPLSHEAGGAHLAELVGMERSQLEDGLGWASERIQAMTHSGTHMDAPWHCAPRSGGQSARTIDQIPLEWCFGPGVCVRVSGVDRATRISLAELRAWEEGPGRAIEAGDIVLFQTGAGAWYGTDRYMRVGRGLSPELVRALAERGVRVIGTDAWSIDPPFDVMRSHLAAEGPHSVWAAHLIGRDIELCILEKLANLGQLPPSGFHVACFPMKVHRGSAGWVRPVAWVPKEVRR